VGVLILFNLVKFEAGFSFWVWVWFGIWGEFFGNSSFLDSDFNYYSH